MQNIARTRLRKELADLERDPPPGIVCYPADDSDITQLESYIKGPPDSPFEQGIFRLDIKITDNYPFDPPQMRFKTKIYHPNIDEGGRICADILKKGVHGGWKPSLNLSTTLLSLQSLLSSPNPDDPLDAEIAKEYTLDYERFVCKAKEFTMRYATGASNEVDTTITGSDDTTESTVQKEDESSFSDDLGEIMVQERTQKNKKSSLSLSSRKRKKPSSDDQLEPDQSASGKSESESSSMLDGSSPMQPSSSTSTTIGRSTEYLSSSASSSDEVTCVPSQDGDAVIITAPAATENDVPLFPMDPTSRSEEQENAHMNKKHENDICFNVADEGKLAPQHAGKQTERNADNEILATMRQSTPCKTPNKLQNLPVNIINLDDETEKSPGSVKKKNKLSLSRTKRLKQQS